MRTIKELKKETIWEKGKVTTIGSQDIEEKTFLALNEGLKAAKSGKNVLYLSLPYNKKEIETRLTYILFNENINFQQATDLVKKLPIEINDKSFLTTPDIVELLKKRENIDLLIIDPLDMMDLFSLNGNTREERFIDIVKRIKKLANDLDIGIILTSHIKRGNVEDDDLKEGKEIAALSDKYFAIKGVRIYEYLFDRKEKHLNLRAFTEKQKRKMYEEQDGVCPICNQHFEMNEMEADHITPWSLGGKTELDNGQMLCVRNSFQN